MSSRAIIEDDDIIGQCPGQCGRAIKRGYIIEDGEKRRALVHTGSACEYYKKRDIDTVLADSAKLAKA